MTDTRRPRPDLAEVFSRARAMDPDAVDPSWGEHPAAIEDSGDGEDSGAELLAFGRELGPMDPQLASFVADVRTHLDAQVADRRLADIPPAPATSRRWGLVALGAAAALLLAGSTAWWVSQASTQQAQAVANEAAYVATGQGGVLQNSRPAGATSGGQASESIPGDAPQSFAGDASIQGALDGAVNEGDAEAIEEPDATPKATPESASTRGHKLAPDKAGPSIDELDAQAQAAWQRGELKRAAQLFERIVKRAPRSRRAELAYADLFSLADQRGDRAELSRLWKAYLKRFPTGRYADDTRARLCRRAATSAKAQCWAEYLRKHPQGAHLREARAAVDGAATPLP